MRSITTHAINPANEKIAVVAIDGPGPGGASHIYGIDVPDAPTIPGRLAYDGFCSANGGMHPVSNMLLPGWGDLSDAEKSAWSKAGVSVQVHCAKHPTLKFQNGPVDHRGAGVNGITHEALLAIIIDRLDAFQRGPYPCPENDNTLIHLREALAIQKSRTEEREARGVEGKLEP